ncbi:MAG: hypothetical protein KY452_09780 [Actinobacteria bacterium]|nr:hypothetical protein [Actinomycetota bacterium]
MQRHRALGFLLIATVLVAGCGEGDDGAEGAGTTTTTAARGTTETTAPASGDEAADRQSTDPERAAQAEAAILRMEDLPEGWREQPPEEGLELEATWQDLTSCLGVEGPEQPLGIATSPTFVRDLATQVRSTVEYMPEAQAQELAAALAGPEFQQCATEAFEEDAVRSAPEGGVPGPVEVSPLEFPELGEQTLAWRVNVTIDLEGLEVPIFQDLVVVFDGEAASRLMFLNPGSEFPPELQRTLVETVVDRAA